MWREVSRNGKLTKPPLQLDGNFASSTDPSTWTTFHEAANAASNGGGDGVGIQLFGSDLWGIDLDHCRDPKTGAVELWAQAIVDRVASYWEISPSREGLRAFGFGKLPPGTRKRGNIEMYDGESGRYLTLTGHHVEGTPLKVRLLEMEPIHAFAFPAPQKDSKKASGGKKTTHPKKPMYSTSPRLDDGELLEKARAARNGAAFGDLYAGKIAKFPSWSEAAASLVHRLSFYTQDVEQIDRIFRTSGMFAEKWDASRGDTTWGCQEIKDALDNLTSTYRGQPVGAEVIEMSATELLAAPLPAPKSLPFLGYVGIVVEGWAHLIASAPKGGKTTLLTQTTSEWLGAGYKVLWITEEPQSVWRARLASLPATNWTGLQFIFGLGQKPDALLDRACSGDEDVVMVDTLRNLLHLQDERDNSEIARTVNPWVARLRDAEKTLILVHHFRKGGGEHGEGITGGHALLGIVDIAVELRRDDNAANRRTLTTLARVIEGQHVIYERRDNGVLIALGDPAQLAIALVKKRVRHLLDSPMLTAEIHKKLGDPQPSLESVRKALAALAIAGRIHRDPPISESAKGKRVRWLPITKPHVQPTTPLAVAGEVEESGHE